MRPNHTRARDCNDTDLVESEKANHLNTYERWSNDGTAPEIYAATMSKRRFHTLLQAIRSDDKLTRSQRKKVDNSTPIHPRPRPTDVFMESGTSSKTVRPRRVLQEREIQEHLDYHSDSSEAPMFGDDDSDADKNYIPEPEASNLRGDLRLYSQSAELIRRTVLIIRSSTRSCSRTRYYLTRRATQ
ncbi:hypothetical protein J6590_091475 [Homalodisca vitripennis]|nr:hypothetical protein J6590_091475 [Homalodisca vitripennis]